LRPIQTSVVAAGEMKYKLISEAYVHEFMDGEAIRWVDNGNLEKRGFLLI